MFSTGRRCTSCCSRRRHSYAALCLPRRGWQCCGHLPGQRRASVPLLPFVRMQLDCCDWQLLERASTKAIAARGSSCRAVCSIADCCDPPLRELVSSAHSAAKRSPVSACSLRQVTFEVGAGEAVGNPVSSPCHSCPTHDLLSGFHSSSLSALAHTANKNTSGGLYLTLSDTIIFVQLYACLIIIVRFKMLTRCWSCSCSRPLMRQCGVCRLATPPH